MSQRSEVRRQTAEGRRQQAGKQRAVRDGRRIDPFAQARTTCAKGSMYPIEPPSASTDGGDADGRKATATESGKSLDRETWRRGDTETRRHGDNETRRHGDTETRRKPRLLKFCVAASPRLPVSASPRAAMPTTAHCSLLTAHCSLLTAHYL